MRIFDFKLWDGRGSVKAPFSWSHEDCEYYDWRILCPEFGQAAITSPRTKISTRDGVIFRNTVRINGSLMRELRKVAFEKYREAKRGNGDA